MVASILNYKIIKELGAGATGKVFLAEDQHNEASQDKSLKAFKTVPLNNVSLVSFQEAMSYAASRYISKQEATKTFLIVSLTSCSILTWK